jgi:hypothetical protein
LGGCRELWGICPIFGDFGGFCGMFGDFYRILYDSMRQFCINVDFVEGRPNASSLWGATRQNIRKDIVDGRHIEVS